MKESSREDLIRVIKDEQEITKDYFINVAQAEGLINLDLNDFRKFFLSDNICSSIYRNLLSNQFFQYFVIGRTEIVIGYFLCCNPTYVVVFQFLRLTFGNGTVEQCQMHCNVRVIMHNFHEHVADIYCNTQFLPTFTYKGLLPALSRFHLAAYKFPQQCSCLVVRSMAG